jgi:Zn-dependent protease with chaperone function
MHGGTRASLRRTYGRLGFPRDLQDALAEMFGIRDSVKVLYVVPGSPVDRAGLKEGDVIGLALMGRAGEPHTMEIRRQAEVLRLRPAYVPQCQYPAYLRLSDDLDATSDGSTILLTTGILHFIDKDADLAFIIGHEVAHNILGHLGLKAQTPRKFEREADYLASYLTARAGFDITGAPAFWRRWALEHPQRISDKWSRTHPSTAERVVILEQVISEIVAKIEGGEPLLPNRSR